MEGFHWYFSLICWLQLLLVGRVDSDVFYLVFLQPFYDKFWPKPVPNIGWDFSVLNSNKSSEFWKVKPHDFACSIVEISGRQGSLVPCYLLALKPLVW